MGYKGTRRAPRRTSGGYKGKHRDSLFGRLAGRPTVGQIKRRNAAPGLFPGFADSWTPAVAPRQRSTRTFWSASFNPRFSQWT